MNKTMAVLALCCAAPAFAQGVLRERGETRPSSQLRTAAERVRIQIDHQYAHTRLEQEFENLSGQRLEGTYVLRTASATVEGFAYWNGEQKIVGEVFEKESARNLYDSVVGRKRDPGLLEQIGEGSFSFQVFPIEPKERKRVEVTFGQRLSRTGKLLEYRFTLAGGESDVLAEIGDANPILGVGSPSHRLELERIDGRHVRARAHGEPGGSRDLVLEVEVDADPWRPSVVVHRDPGQDPYLVLQMAAPARIEQSDVSRKHVTVVIDRSGSMTGAPLDQARAAAALVVKRLHPSDHVNVISFDDDVDVLFARPQPVATARDAALQFIGRIRAGGGTDIARALDRALRGQEDDHLPHLVLFLTDGQSPSAAALAVAQRDRGDARVFTIGLGSGVEKALLSRLAATKHGRFTYIESPEAIEERVQQLFLGIEAPALVGLSLEARGATLGRIYPRTLPDLSAGDDLLVAARVQGATPGQKLELVVHGTLAGRQVEFPVSVVLPERASRSWAARLWARSRIDDLLEEVALHGRQAELQEEIVGLGLAYSLVTPYTSFLAIPASELDGGQAETLVALRLQRKAALEARRDAAALSRQQMPPGDPVLTVAAPRDAVQVTAYFPFGQVKDLAWDARLERWVVRFLVPRGVADGEYEAVVIIVKRGGEVELAKAAYVIDSKEPDFEVEATTIASGVHLRVTVGESARRVSAVLVGASRNALELAGDGRVFEGDLQGGSGRVRVVVADQARNETVREVTPR